MGLRGVIRIQYRDSGEGFLSEVLLIGSMPVEVWVPRKGDGEVRELFDKTPIRKLTKASVKGKKNEAREFLVEAGASLGREARGEKIGDEQ